MTETEKFNTIVHGDCIAGMSGLTAGSVDLVFADPPFNIGYDYDVYHDKQERDAYLDWSKRWIGAVHQALKPTGTFWLAIGDDYAAELKLLSQEIGFHCRSWVIWYYTFGVNCKVKFTRSHTHLFYFLKDKKNFTFRAEELGNRIPSARQLVYADGRANPDGRLPDDTWVLRPQDLADCFTPEEDTWYFPRVAGTFKERAGFHGCQMPEQLLGRIIRLCSQEGELVLDPFSGSATTVAVAKKLGRRYLAFDLSVEYVTRGLARLEGSRVGDPLDGAAEPTMSAPATAKGGEKKKRAAAKTPGEVEREQQTADSAAARNAMQKGLLEAFRRTYDGFSLDRVIADPDLNVRLAAVCEELGLPGERRDWNSLLFQMRKAGVLVGFVTLHRTEFDWDACEDYLFASEIAWRQVAEEHNASLDGIFCDPFLANQFDEIAKRWAPGKVPLAYRWGAMKLRKSAKSVRARAEALHNARFRSKLTLDCDSLQKVPEQSGIYVVGAPGKVPLYAGQTNNLRHRLDAQFGDTTRHEWQRFAKKLDAKYFLTSCNCTDRLAYQWQLVEKHQPRLNRLDYKPT